MSESSVPNTVNVLSIRKMAPAMYMSSAIIEKIRIGPVVGRFNT